jgi:transcriptional regulator with XRE-family HTH domain
MLKRDSVLAKLGLNVRKRREARELTQETLAERAGLDSSYISGIERGLRNPGSSRQFGNSKFRQVIECRVIERW